MPSLREQTDAKFANTLKNNPEFAKRIDDLLSSADTFQAGANAVEVGQLAPDFELPDAQGETVLLSELLFRSPVRGPVVVTFYRGS